MALIAHVLTRQRSRVAEPLTHLSVRVPRRLLRGAKLAALRDGVRLQTFIAAACAAKLERGTR